MKEKNRGYILKLFKPNIYYEQGVEKSYIRLNSKLETRCENGDLIEGDKIVEYRYILEKYGLVGTQIANTIKQKI